MSVASPQLPTIETINAEGGKMFVLASGGRLTAGDTLDRHAAESPGAQPHGRATSRSGSPP